jgi:predicted AlkP superfamily pyrophosphatase or phosphodiesterase
VQYCVAVRFLLVALLFACASPRSNPRKPEARARLVVVIVVDQFRADYLTRFAPRFFAPSASSPGGYRFFTERAAYWPFARYDLLQAMTGPGHATVLTGSYPYRNGISLNAWCTTDAHGRTRTVYCVQDEAAPLVGGNPPLSQKEPAIVCDAASGPGISPRRLQGGTLGDALKLAGHPSRVVAIALKDRAAVLLGGHLADLALWFDSQQFHWISSKYYLSGGQLPDWVAQLNSRLDARRGEAVRFASEGPGTGLTRGIFDIEARFGEKSALKTPLGNSITVDAALAAISALDLGRGEGPDLLAISLSTHDWLGHDLGPNRREMEEMTVAEDRQIERLLSGIAARLSGGLDEAVIALTGDHGIAPSPAYLSGLGRDPSLSGYIDAPRVVARAEAGLTKLFGPPAGGTWISGTADLNFWLNDVSVAVKKLARDDAARELRGQIAAAMPEAAFVFTRADVAARRVPGGALGEHILRGYRDGQGGDVVAIPKPWFTVSGDVTTHMTDYSYDATVPLAIAAPRLVPGTYAEDAHVVDLAPTLAFLLGVVPPELNEGRVLSEAVRR